MVKGLVIQTLAIAAGRDALSTHAITSAIPIWNPIAGKKATNKPMETPSAIRLGLVWKGNAKRTY